LPPSFTPTSLPVVAQNDRLDAEERRLALPGLSVCAPGNGRDEDAAGPSVCHHVPRWDNLLADDAVIPQPGLGLIRSPTEPRIAQRVMSCCSAIPRQPDEPSESPSARCRKP